MFTRKTILALCILSLTACTTTPEPQKVAAPIDPPASAQAVGLPVREYDCDGLRLTLDADGSASLHFQNGDTRRLTTPLQSMMNRSVNSESQTQTASLNNASFNLLRLHAALKNLIPSVAVEVVSEKNSKSHQASQLATRWLTQKTIPVQPKTPGLPTANHPLSPIEESTLKNALAGIPPAAPQTPKPTITLTDPDRSALTLHKQNP